MFWQQIRQSLHFWPTAKIQMLQNKCTATHQHTQDGTQHPAFRSPIPARCCGDGSTPLRASQKWCRGLTIIFNFNERCNPWGCQNTGSLVSAEACDSGSSTKREEPETVRDGTRETLNTEEHFSQMVLSRICCRKPDTCMLGVYWGSVDSTHYHGTAAVTPQKQDSKARRKKEVRHLPFGSYKDYGSTCIISFPACSQQTFSRWQLPPHFAPIYVDLAASPGRPDMPALSGNVRHNMPCARCFSWASLPSNCSRGSENRMKAWRASDGWTVMASLRSGLWWRRAYAPRLPFVLRWILFNLWPWTSARFLHDSAQKHFLRSMANLRHRQVPYKTGKCSHHRFQCLGFGKVQHLLSTWSLTLNSWRTSRVGTLMPCPRVRWVPPAIKLELLGLLWTSHDCTKTANGIPPRLEAHKVKQIRLPCNSTGRLLATCPRKTCFQLDTYHSAIGFPQCRKGYGLWRLNPRHLSLGCVKRACQLYYMLKLSILHRMRTGSVRTWPSLTRQHKVWFGTVNPVSFTTLQSLQPYSLRRFRSGLSNKLSHLSQG